MRLITPKEVACADAFAVQTLGCNILEMIESAAESLFERCVAFRRVTVLCGGGNNGADGLCAAEKLARYGVSVSVWLFVPGGEKTIHKNCLYFEERLHAAGIPVKRITEIDAFTQDIKAEIAAAIAGSDAVLECLLGTGFDPSRKRETDGVLADLIRTVNQNASYIISADIAAGIDGASGAAFAESIAANETVTFGYPKVGNVILPGKAYCGKLSVKPVSVPEEAYRFAMGDERAFLSREDVKSAAKLLPTRDPYGHKGTFGKVLIIAGSEGMTGAAVLCARACLKSGAGLVYIAAPRGLLPVYETLLPEAVKLPLGDPSDLWMKEEHTETLIKHSGEMNAVVMGPGLGRREDTVRAVLSFLLKTPCRRLLLDADALRAIAGKEDLLSSVFLKKEVVLTPHEGELAALIRAENISAVSRNRLRSTLACASQYGSIVVCKGNDTITCRNEQCFTVNGTGNAGMAVCGSGDVLSGVIASLLAADDEKTAYDAARLGVYLHGLAGDAATEALTQYCVTAGDMIAKLPDAFRVLVSAAERN